MEAQPKPTAAKGERVRSAPMSMVGTLNDFNAISLCLSELLSRFHFTCLCVLGVTLKAVASLVLFALTCIYIHIETERQRERERFGLSFVKPIQGLRA